jgi:hypothetical protein
MEMPTHYGYRFGMGWWRIVYCASISALTSLDERSIVPLSLWIDTLSD